MDDDAAASAATAAGALPTRFSFVIVIPPRQAAYGIIRRRRRLYLRELTTYLARIRKQEESKWGEELLVVVYFFLKTCNVYPVPRGKHCWRSHWYTYNNIYTASALLSWEREIEKYSHFSTTPPTNLSIRIVQLFTTPLFGSSQEQNVQKGVSTSRNVVDYIISRNSLHLHLFESLLLVTLHTPPLVYVPTRKKISTFTTTLQISERD